MMFLLKLTSEDGEAERRGCPEDSGLCDQTDGVGAGVRRDIRRRRIY